jgi:membrane-bound inhibitor of C-type lysozyme
MKHTRVTILSAVVLSLTTLLNVPALAFADDRFATQVKLSEPIPGFGMTVDIDGNTAAVGASGFRFSDFPLPVVCVYTREAANWTKEQCLSEEDEAPNSDDGYGVIAVSGNTLVVGAAFDVTNGVIGGAVYVYVRDGHTWSLQQKLFASDRANFDQFGIAVDIVGDTIVVGAHGDNDEGFQTGAVYVFRRNGTTWTEEQKLKASDAAPDTAFGVSVALSGQTVAIGAPGESSGALSSGAVYVFVNDGTSWQQQGKIKANNVMMNQQLGLSVSVSGDTIVAAAPGELIGEPAGDLNNVLSKGAVYIFQRTGTSWDHQKRFFERDRNRTGGFAVRAAIDGDTIIVGDPTYDAGARFTGAVYVFERKGNGWSLKHTLAANDGQFLQAMGFSISVSGDTVIAGTQSQFSIPAVYIFQ